ncbi:MAG: hypothetical protein HY300_18660 [Verrucomicrobia bacterium]|nr:hypothetical protein [Verrucomicrobiota bacterium]
MRFKAVLTALALVAMGLGAGCAKQVKSTGASAPEQPAPAAEPASPPAITPSSSGSPSGQAGNSQPPLAQPLTEGQPAGLEAASRTDPTLPPDMARYGRELAHVIMLAQKHALKTGHFPQNWDEMIAAKLITAPPKGPNGKPMTWREFLAAMDK